MGRISKAKLVNPIKGDVSDSQPNAGGGHFGPPPVINEGAP